MLRRQMTEPTTMTPVGAPDMAALYTIGIYDSTGAISTMTPSFNAWNALKNTAFAIANRASLKAPGEGRLGGRMLCRRACPSRFWFVI